MGCAWCTRIGWDSGTEAAAGVPVSMSICTCPHRNLFLPLLLCLEVSQPHPYRPGQPGTSWLGSCCPSQASQDQPSTFSDPVRQSSRACFRPEEQFLLSAPWPAPRMLSSCGYHGWEQVHQGWQLFPCLNPSSWQRFWTAQLGHSLVQPATQFPQPLAALVPSSATTDGNMAVVALGTGVSLIG